MSPHGTVGDMNTPTSPSPDGTTSARLIDIAEVQDRLGVSRTKVIDLIDAGVLTGVRIDTARRVVESSVDDYIGSLIEET